MLVPRHHFLFAAIGHTQQRAISAHSPDHAVRLLLVGKLRNATLRDMLCQDGHVRRLVGRRVHITNIPKLPNLARAALQEQRHICHLHRLRRRSAVVRILADQRRGRRHRAVARRGHNILAAAGADSQHARRRHIPDRVHIIRRNRVDQRVVISRADREVQVVTVL